MATNKNKQNLRFRKVSERINKRVRYDGLTEDQIKFIKTKNEYDLIEKSMNEFWRNAPRLPTSQVDWNSMNEQELDYFEYINKKQEKLFNRMSRLEDKGVSPEDTMNLFMMLNTYSVSF